MFKNVKNIKNIKSIKTTQKNPHIYEYEYEYFYQLSADCLLGH